MSAFQRLLWHFSVDILQSCILEATIYRGLLALLKICMLSFRSLLSTRPGRDSLFPAVLSISNSVWSLTALQVHPEVIEFIINMWSWHLAKKWASAVGPGCLIAGVLKLYLVDTLLWISWPAARSDQWASCCFAPSTALALSLHRSF